MKEILICWIGFTDLKASAGKEDVGLGPIAQAVTSLSFDEIHLISDRQESEDAAYIKWLNSKCASKIILHKTELSGPTHFGEIYESAVKVLEEAKRRYSQDIALTFHLSPGTLAMAAVWVILSKTRYPATLIEFSIEKGVKVASVPFDMSAEFIPDLLRGSDKRL